MNYNTGFRNACILRDILKRSGARGENAPVDCKTDKLGNITHINGRRVIKPRGFSFYTLAETKN